MRQYIGFKLGSMEYTIPILKVREIINTPVVTRMPQAPAYIEGVTNLRGSIIVIVSLRVLLNTGGPQNEGTGGKIIVVSSGKITFGVLVDGITGVVEVDDSAVEHPERFFSERMEQIKGVAKIKDKLLVLLDPRKLIPFEDMSLFEDDILDVTESGDGSVEVTKRVQTMAGEVTVKEVQNAKQFFGKKMADGEGDGMVNEIMLFLDAIGNNEYEKAETIIQGIMTRGRGDIYNEVGRVTRKLHNSLKNFKEAIDPKLKEAAFEMPQAVDRLQFVIDRTEEAANKTMSFVEGYILSMDELSSHIRQVKEPQETADYLRNFKNKLEDDLTEVLTTQSFQDLTGQALKKVIELVGDVEKELVMLITGFGLNMEQGVSQAIISEQVTQEGVDSLLTELGF